MSRRDVISMYGLTPKTLNTGSEKQERQSTVACAASSGTHELSVLWGAGAEAL